MRRPSFLLTSNFCSQLSLPGAGRLELPEPGGANGCADVGLVVEHRAVDPYDHPHILTNADVFSSTAPHQEMLGADPHEIALRRLDQRLPVMHVAADAGAGERKRHRAARRVRAVMLGHDREL